MLNASVKLLRVPFIIGQQLHQHHQQDEYRCLLNHAPCFVCRQVILKINLTEVDINFFNIAVWNVLVDVPRMAARRSAVPTQTVNGRGEQKDVQRNPGWGGEAKEKALVVTNR